MKRAAFIAVSVVVVAYVIAGAVIFHFIEGVKEQEVRQDFASKHKAFLESHTCVSPEALREYLLMALDSQAQGIDVAAVVQQNATNMTNVISPDVDETKWDITSNVFFCLTIITTVGYGRVTPKTSGGQLFCVFYALLGIPLFATALLGVGERLQIPLKKIKNSKAWWKNNPKRDSQLKSVVCLTGGVLLLIFAPSAIFGHTENWSFVESFYYCIITLTTVGFGDYVPGRHSVTYSGLYRILMSIWILLGLSWIALILSELSTFLQSNIMRAARTTESRLGDLEEIVRKKAKEARERIVHKASTYRRRFSERKDEYRPASDDHKSQQFEGADGDQAIDMDDRPEIPQHKMKSTRIPNGYDTPTDQASVDEEVDDAMGQDPHVEVTSNVVEQNPNVRL